MTIATTNYSTTNTPLYPYCSSALVCYYYNDMTIATTNYSTTNTPLYPYCSSALTTLLLLLEEEKEAHIQSAYAPRPLCGNTSRTT